MRIRRSFAHEKATVQVPWYGIQFHTREVVITGGDGHVHHSATIEVPVAWSDTAAAVLSQKYMRRMGIPDRTLPVEEVNVPKAFHRRIPDAGAKFGGETSAKQVFHRLAGAWTYWATKFGHVTSTTDITKLYLELFAMLALQVAAPNSPQWFNTGLHWSYGIEGNPQGHYYFDGNQIVPSQNAYEHPQVSACFIQSVTDNLVGTGGIMDLWLKESRLFKQGSGTGTNFSTLRGEGEQLSGGGKSSGLMSFLKVGDASAGAIKSGGTTRRAAKMNIVDADHPDIEKYVEWKVREEDKVAAMVTGSKTIRRHLEAIADAIADIKYTLRMTSSGSPLLDAVVNPKFNAALLKAVATARAADVPDGLISRCIQALSDGEKFELPRELDLGWEGEAYQTVSGQNANNSVRVTDEFMHAVLTDSEWRLLRRTDGGVHKTIKARDLWHRIGKSAWASADPGLQFDTTINDWHTCPAGGRIRGSNPCSEFLFIDNNSCNLASLNLKAFKSLKLGSEFDFDQLEHVVTIWTIVLDVSVDMAQYPSENIAAETHKYRTLGLGYANVGGLLMSLGIPYNSDEGRALIGGITALMTGVAYATSADMAAQLGVFDGFNANRKSMLRVIENHAAATGLEVFGNYSGLSINPPKLNIEAINQRWPSLSTAIHRCWFRAISIGKTQGFRNAQVTVIAPTGCTLSTTRIRTNNGIKSYRDIMEENGIDWHALESTNDKQWLPLKLFGLPSLDGYADTSDKIWYNGHEDTYIITFADGSEFECTGNHKLLVCIGSITAWIEAENLKGDEEVVSY